MDKKELELSVGTALPFCEVKCVCVLGGGGGNNVDVCIRPPPPSDWVCILAVRDIFFQLFYRCSGCFWCG